MCVQPGPLQPHAGQLDVLAKSAFNKWQAGVGQAQRCDVPAHHLCAGRQVHGQAVFCQAAAVAQRFQRQPFQPRTGRQLHMRALHSQLAQRAVKTRRPRRGHQRVRARGHCRLNVQRVTAHQPARRMHQHVVAHRIALGVKALQDAQRPLVAVMRHRAPSAQRVVKFQ